jgi:hypothetical protein
MDNQKEQEIKKEYTDSEKLVISAANLLNDIDIEELEEAKKKILERKENIEIKKDK